MSAPAAKFEQLAQSIPSLPGVVMEVKKNLNDLNNSLSNIEQTINKDPAFSARVLKLANSAYYGVSFKISTISQALMFLGLSELRSLLIGTSMIKAFKDIKNPSINMESFWRHSVACAICSRQLAVRQREVNAEEFFVAGLMHDIGRLIILCSLPQKAEQAYELAVQKRISIIEAENETFHCNHADLSAQVLKEWKLPASLCEIVKAHHHPSLSPAHASQALLVHASDVIVDAMGIGNSGEGPIAPLADLNLNMFQNPATVLAMVMDEVDSMLEELVKVFLADA